MVVRVADDSVLNVTLALRRPETAVATANYLQGATGEAEVSGLVELLYQPPSARAAVAAIAALQRNDADNARDRLIDSLGNSLSSQHTSVRLAAVQALRQRRSWPGAHSLARLLHEDPSWMVRRAALLALADYPEHLRWRVYIAVDDPHWRVRHAFVQIMLRWPRTEADRLISHGKASPRIEGLRRYLRYRWTGQVPAPAEIPVAANPGSGCPFWDGDPAVIVRRVEQMDDNERRVAAAAMPDLLDHEDERVRRVAVDVLRSHGEAPHLARAVALLDDPRRVATESVQELLGFLNLDRVEETARLILHWEQPAPAQLAWAIDQAGIVFPMAEEHAKLLDLLRQRQPRAVEWSLARLAGRADHPEILNYLFGFLDSLYVPVRREVARSLGPKTKDAFIKWVLETNRMVNPRETQIEAAITTFLQVRSSIDYELGDELTKAATRLRVDVSFFKHFLDPDPDVGIPIAEELLRRQTPEAQKFLDYLQVASHPLVRAAALTHERAAALMENPEDEISWHVLAQAARLTHTPLWQLEPEHPWQPPPEPQPETGPLSLTVTRPSQARLLGSEGLVVSPLGISGAYGLPVEGFVRAVEAGVNVFFWEPSYHTLTEFCRRLSEADRQVLHLMAGTFEGDAKRIRRDVERALRQLQIECLSLFLLFWVRSENRIVPEVRACLERLKYEGKIAMFGLSTHSRPLAAKELDARWDTIMVRHSAAHRGAERHIFPRAVEVGTSIITFNNTCYGRLLEAQGDLPVPRAGDCYRYTLSQPGVTTCLSAPATLDELDENLTVLRDPVLPEERRQMLLAQGERVYLEDSIFRMLIRAL